MAFSKKNFVDNQTVIDADTLNAIQDELIRVAGLLGKDIAVAIPAQQLCAGSGSGYQRRRAPHGGRLCEAGPDDL